VQDEASMRGDGMFVFRLASLCAALEKKRYVFGTTPIAGSNAQHTADKHSLAR
jgi:hypothetical protein